ncbi:beta-lactamase-like protein [Sporodiniella umbellata]|nr:beta-lactamase-like protein [Sporodiniella umbellata]
MATVEEIVFLGTGTSSSVPTVACLTDPEKKCLVCLDAMTAEGYKNNRKNTSLLVRFRKHSDPPNARLRNVLIDCGKTFYNSAIHILPQYDIRYLDGVILTHGHADACYGLDDLRGWTLNNAIQPHVNIHLSTEGMEVVQRTFPFLVDASLATGGGQVADFQYHVFDAHTPFTIEGLEFTPLQVHHGIYQATKAPYFCYGFKFGDVSYISDTNHIPQETMQLIQGKSRLFIVDCLRGKSSTHTRHKKLICSLSLVGNPHPSHFSLEQSLEASRTVAAYKSYYVGFSHRIDHLTLENDLKALEKTEGLRAAPAYDGLRLILKGQEIVESFYLQ